MSACIGTKFNWSYFWLLTARVVRVVWLGCWERETVVVIVRRSSGKVPLYRNWGDDPTFELLKGKFGLKSNWDMLLYTMSWSEWHRSRLSTTFRSWDMISESFHYITSTALLGSNIIQKYVECTQFEPMMSQKWCNRNFQRSYLKNEMPWTGNTYVIQSSALCMTTYLSLILGPLYVDQPHKMCNALTFIRSPLYGSTT